jgi:hypothetical protein
MRHKQFEQMIFEQDELGLEEKQALQRHFVDCDACYDLDNSDYQIEKLLKAAPQVGPTYGFAQRFERRLQADKARREMRQSWLVLGFNILGAIGILAAFWPVFLDEVPAWLSNRTAMFWQLLEQVEWLSTIANVVASVVEALPQSVLLFAWISFLGVVLLITAGWFKMFRKLVHYQGIKRWA